MENESNDPILDQFWLQILIITFILFAIERIYFLKYIDGQGWYQIILFLYGQPPLDIFDILFGLSFNNNTILDYFNVRNLAILITQATHFYANYYVVYGIFKWLIKRNNN